MKDSLNCVAPSQEPFPVEKTISPFNSSTMTKAGGRSPGQMHSNRGTSTRLNRFSRIRAALGRTPAAAGAVWDQDHSVGEGSLPS